MQGVQRQCPMWRRPQIPKRTYGISPEGPVLELVTFPRRPPEHNLAWQFLGFQLGRVQEVRIGAQHVAVMLYS
eukprot:7458256-Pyramimonas_sp.AAC.1